MKVLIISDARNIHTKRWTSSLKEKGIDIVVFSIDPYLDDFYHLNKIKLYTFDLFNYKGKKFELFLSLKNHIKAVSILKNIIRIEKPDILHSHYLTSYSLIGTFTKFKPHIVSAWGSDVYVFPKQSIINKLSLKYILRQATTILSTSHSMANEMRKYTKKDIQITPFGVDIDLFKKHPLEENNIINIGVVKTLSANYGIDLAIRAFHTSVLNNPSLNLNLQIIGKGPDEKKLKDLAWELNICEQIEFLGHIPNNELPYYYSNFRVSIFLSYLESFGVVAVESMSCECPVIASRTDGFSEVIADGQTGFLVPIGDYQAAAERIQYFIENPEKGKTMGKNGRTRVLENYSWESNVSTMCSIYQITIVRKQIYQ